ncbi:MAG: AraC family transcriptional regulator [Pseudomonadota bacterium]
MRQSVQVYSTRGVPALRRAALWNSILNEFSHTLHVLPRDPMQFDGTLIRQRVGRLTLFEIRCSGVRVRYTQANVSGSKRSSYQVLMPIQGEFALTHDVKPSVAVSTGSICLVDQSLPYEMVHGDGLRAIGVEFPRAVLESCLPNASRHVGSVVLPVAAASRVLGELLRALGAELHCEPRAGIFPSALARSITGFVAAVFADAAVPATGRGLNARLVAYREFVESHLGEGDFRPVDLADHFNVSERYVRTVFQSAGEPLSAFLLRRRLERAASLLGSAEYANRTIMEIALECGFNSASHFGQSFRKHYRVTPRAFRSA